MILFLYRRKLKKFGFHFKHKCQPKEVGTKPFMDKEFLNIGLKTSKQ
jgi:hypothetical protein